MDLLAAITEQPESFVQPPSNLHESALKFAKLYIDPLAIQITNAQTQRLHDYRRSRKRKRASRTVEDEKYHESELLRMKQIHTDGFDFHQIWHQAKQVLDATGNELARSLPSNVAAIENEHYHDSSEPDLSEEVYNDTEDESLGEEGIDWKYDAEDNSQVEDDAQEGLSDNQMSRELPDDLSEDDSTGRPLSDEDMDGREHQAESFIQDPNGLNDGFFSIDNFNKSTQFLEQQNARGDPNDGAASDEEDIDWTADPLTQSFAQSNQFKQQQRAVTDEISNDESDDDENGPIFGHAELDGLDSDADIDDSVEIHDPTLAHVGNGFSNTNDILYSDFFAPPARNIPKSKKQGKRSGRFQDRDTPLKQSLAKEDGGDEADADEQDEELKRAMAGVQRDLFDEESDAQSEIDDENSEIPVGQRNLSSHERKQLALRAEIRQLEAETVAEKPWAMTGETVAPTRPQNALLEEDLDFERAGKPVPIITTEINESIEDLIKRRILSKEFDEVRRRRPDDVLNGGEKDPRRGRIEEVSDTKSKKSLAEEYEEDYLRKNDPSFVDTRSEALKKQHREIEQQWAHLSAQLDALSNWHYKPRPVAPSLDVRVDVPTVSLEDARPAAGGDVAGASAMAPQELYKTGADGKRSNEVITKGGTVAGRDEETQDQRKRRRRRQKERRRKMEGNKAIVDATLGNQTDESKTKRTKKSDVISQLKKGGVRVIGKKGDLQDVEGNAIKNKQALANGSKYRL